MLLAHGPHWSRDGLDHRAGEWPIWDLNPHCHTAQSSVGSALKSTLMRVNRECMRGQRREGLFLTRGLKEGGMEEVVCEGP